MMTGSLLSPNGWSSLEQSSNVVRTVVASAAMSPSGTTSSHVVRDVAPDGPLCTSRTSISSLVQSCSMRSTYAVSVYGWILCSARLRAWASCCYRVQCRGAGLGGGVAAGSGVGSFFSGSLCPCWVACTRVYSSSCRPGVHSRWASPVDAMVGRHVAVRAWGGACLVMQDDGVAPCPTVQGWDESRRCFLEVCWRWGVGFLDEGQGFLCVWGSREVRPRSSFGLPSLHHHSFR